VAFFSNERIVLYEAAGLFMIYVLYCTFMKYNDQLEAFVKTKLLIKDITHSRTNSIIANTAHVEHMMRVLLWHNIYILQNIQFQTTEAISSQHATEVTNGHIEVDAEQRPHSTQPPQNRQSIPRLQHRRQSLHGGSAMYRGGIIQLMVHPLEELNESGCQHVAVGKLMFVYYL
jgi:hypothetical protein